MRTQHSGRHATRFGFTLVELLVVISIIALLIAILLPSLRKARDQAKKVVCGNRLHQLSLAHVAYAIDNNGFFVPGGLAKDGGWPLWYISETEGGAFAPYWQGHDSEREPLLACPSDRGPYPVEKDPTKADHESQTSYGLNSWAKRIEPGSSVYTRWGPGGNTMARSRNAGTTMLMAEVWRWAMIMDRDALRTGTWDAHYDPSPTQPDRYPGNLEWDDKERHSGILNFLHVDGHVGSRSKQEGIPRAADSPDFWGPVYDIQEYEEEDESPR